MANHDVHCEPPPFKKEDMRIKMVMQPTPKDEVNPKCVLSSDDATHFLTPAFSSGLFVVLLYNLQECTVTVFDGLYMDIKHWEAHIVHTLKYYGVRQQPQKQATQDKDERLGDMVKLNSG